MYFCYSLIPVEHLHIRGFVNDKISLVFRTINFIIYMYFKIVLSRKEGLTLIFFTLTTTYVFIFYL